MFQSTECIPFLEKRHCVTIVCICKILFQHSHWQSRISIYQKWKVCIDLYWLSSETAECLFNLILFNHLLAKWLSAGVGIWYLWMISIHNTANRYVFAWGKSSQGLWEPRCCRYQLSKWTSHQIFLIFSFLDSLLIDHENQLWRTSIL